MVATLSIKPGQEVFYFGQKFVIRRVLDLETVLAAEYETGENQTLKIKDVSKENQDNGDQRSTVELLSVPKEDRDEAERRLEIIQPLLGKGKSKADVEKQAKEAGVHPATVYRWLAQYEVSGKMSSLLPTKRGGGRGTSRLDSEIEAIIQGAIDEHYLSKQRPSIQKTCFEVARRCRAAGVDAPHSNTVRNRISWVSKKKKLEKRHGSKAARIDDPMPGEFPEVRWPGEFHQLDHTLVDLTIVDDIHRLPIGRPWITVAIDIYSRTVPGFYVSLDPPGNLSTGLCLAHSILPKDGWLSRLGIQTPWPNWGLMQNIHMDNAKEFKGDFIRMVCKEYGINPHWRPVTKPRYGAHIERLLGTFNEDIHTLPGSTFSNVREKAEYDSEGRAIFTLSEFDAWLTKYIVEIYHQKKHSSLEMSPIAKYKLGILGDGDTPGIGIPERIVDEDRLRINFMPLLSRTVQNYGIVIDDIHYYADVLRPWINADDPEPGNNGKRQFLIRQDPRDISSIFFYDPEIEDYFRVPYRNTSRPPMSIWELREARRRLREKGEKEIDEDLIFRAYDELIGMVEEASAKTKTARRMSQRKREHDKVSMPKGASQVDIPASAPIEDIGDIEPFDELEELSDD